MYEQSQEPPRQQLQPVAVPYQQQQIPLPQVEQPYQQPVYQQYQAYQPQPQIDYHEGEQSLPNYPFPQHQPQQPQQPLIVLQPQYGVTPYVQQQSPSFGGVPQPNVPQHLHPYTPLMTPVGPVDNIPTRPYEEELKDNLQSGKCCGFMSHRIGFLVSVITQFVFQILVEILVNDPIYWYFIITIMCTIGFIGGYKYLFNYSFHMVTVFTLYSIAMGFLYVITFVVYQLAGLNVAVYVASVYCGIRFLQIVKKTKKKYNKNVC